MKPSFWMQVDGPFLNSSMCALARRAKHSSLLLYPPPSLLCLHILTVIGSGFSCASFAALELPHRHTHRYAFDDKALICKEIVYKIKYIG